MSSQRHRSWPVSATLLQPGRTPRRPEPLHLPPPRRQRRPLAERARQLAAIVDSYCLTARQRRGFLDQMIEFAVCDTAWEADDAAITPEMTADPIALWAMAWRARSAAGRGVSHGRLRRRAC